VRLYGSFISRLGFFSLHTLRGDKGRVLEVCVPRLQERIKMLSSLASVDISYGAFSRIQENLWQSIDEMLVFAVHSCLRIGIMLNCNSFNSAGAETSFCGLWWIFIVDTLWILHLQAWLLLTSQFT
jgi:hypothetical protein